MAFCSPAPIIRGGICNLSGWCPQVLPCGSSKRSKQMHSKYIIPFNAFHAQPTDAHALFPIQTQPFPEHLASDASPPHLLPQPSPNLLPAPTSTPPWSTEKPFSSYSNWNLTHNSPELSHTKTLMPLQPFATNAVRSTPPSPSSRNEKVTALEPEQLPRLTP